MPKRREIRDPIHGFINRTELEEKIIDTTVFQRLRGIKQLAMANLVYPGAMHTRFDHCIGAMHIAGRLAKRLIDEDEAARIIRIATLLHDVGHGPFSHVSEDTLERYYDQGKVKPKAKEKIHEHVTGGIIERSSEIRKLISDGDRETIIGLLWGTGGEPIYRGIISGPLDADKQDYLLRDSYFCGVKYGVFDLERLIETLQVYPDGHEYTLSASIDGIYAIEQFVLAKYHMTTQVYRHKVRLVTDAMITRALELGIEVDRLDWLIELYTYDGSERYIENYLKWDDPRLTTALLHPLAQEGLATDLFRKLANRKLFKRVFTSPLREFSDPSIRDLLASISKEPKLCKDLEGKIAEFLSSKCGKKIDKTYVIAKAFTIKSVREQSRNDEGSIVIITASGPRKFEEESTLFRSIKEEEHDRFFEVYAPVVYKDEVDKRKRKEEFQQGIKEILVQGASEKVAERKK